MKYISIDKSLLKKTITCFCFLLSLTSSAQVTFMGQFGGIRGIPTSVVYDGNNRLYSMDYNSLVVFDTNGITIREKNIVIAGNSNINYKVAAITKNQHLVLISTSSTKILAFLDTSLNVVSYSTTFPAGGRLESAADAGNGYVYVGHHTPHSFIKFRISDASEIRSFQPQNPLGIPKSFHVDVNSDILYHSGVLQRIDTFGKNKGYLNVEHYSAFYTSDSTFIFGQANKKEIHEYSNTNRKIRTLNIKPFGFVKTLNAPNVVFKTPGGNYIVLDNLGKSGGSDQLLYIFSNTGVWLNTLGRPSTISSNATLNHLLPSPEILALDHNGTLSALCGLDLRSYDGTFIGRGGGSKGTILTITPELKLQNHFSLGSSVNVQDINYKNKIIHYTSSDGAIARKDSLVNSLTSLGTTGLALGDFAIDNQGNFLCVSTSYLASSPVFVVYKNNKFGTFGETLGNPNYDLSKNGIPGASSIALLSNGDMVIGDMQQNQVHVLDKKGNYLRWHHKYGHNPENVCFPTAIATDQFDNIFICEALNHRIKVTDKNGNLIGNIGTKGSGIGQFDAPSDITIDTLRKILYVADRNNHRVQTFKINYPLNVILSRREYSTEIGLTLFPNPVKNQLYINTNETIIDLEMVDYTGNVVIKSGDYNSNTGIDVSNLSRGIYMLKINTSKGTVNKKVTLIP